MADGQQAESKSRWSKAITEAEKFFQQAHEHGRKVYERYQDRREGLTYAGTSKRANLFYSNVNTIKESLFNSLPKPDVYRLHKNAYEDDVSRVAAIIVSRGLEYETHCANDFAGAIRGAILDRLVPGTGNIWIRFGEPESIFVDHVQWCDFLYSPARNWSAVTWVARRVWLTKAEFTESYGQEATEKAFGAENTVPRNGDSPSTQAEQTLVKGQTCVYEVWDKKTRTVTHYSKVGDIELKKMPDPYRLRDFFPCPRPLIANPTTNVFLPITDYHVAQDQYTQLDVIYARMGLIVESIKVAGVYDASHPEVGRMLQGQENKLIPVDNWAMFAERGGVKGAIDWYPVETVVQVLQHLQSEFESVKQVLYEVSGMSDIIRGASNQYETAKAQEIKAGFAGVRLGGYQRDVAEFVRDTIRIMAELMTQLYSDEKLQAIVGPLDPSDETYIPQAVATLRDDVLSKYSVNIQADSLTQADWALEKESRTELVQNLSQFLVGGAQLVAQDPSYSSLFYGMLKFSITGYKASAELEGLLDQYISQAQQAAQQAAENPQPQPPSPEEQKLQLEQQKMDAEMQMEQMRFQMEQQKAQQEAQLAQQESMQRLQLEQAQAQADLMVQREKAQLDAQLKQMEIQHKQQMMALELQMKQLEMQMKMREKQMDMAVSVAESEMDRDERAEERAENLVDRQIERKESAKDREVARKAKPKEKK